MYKLLLFPKDLETINIDFETLTEIFDLFHEKTWGLSKNECQWDTNREGFFVCELNNPTIKCKKFLMKNGVTDDFFYWSFSKLGRRLNTEKDISFIILTNEYNIDELFENIDAQFEYNTDNIKKYIISVNREVKLNKIGL